MKKNSLHINKKEKRITVDQYNGEINASIQQIENGEVISHKEILKQSKTWLKRK